MSDAPATTDEAAADPAACLRPTPFIDSDAPEVVAYARRAAGDAGDEVETAKRLYLAVRDDFRYDPYRIDPRPELHKASAVLARGYGFCVDKAVVLAAAARAEGIPARLGFADVRNHLISPRMQKMMGDTEVLAYHGYTELFLGGRWVKATPAFNLGLCEKAGVLPLEFDGVNDSIFHPFDAEGRRHMEYVRDRGVHVDVPYEEMMRCFAELYGIGTDAGPMTDGASFEDEVTAG